MEGKVRLIKKEDRDGPVPSNETEVNSDPRDWSTTVKSWVKELKQDSRTESLEAFDNLFDDPTR
jgi:hypothetical protein